MYLELKKFVNVLHSHKNIIKISQNINTQTEKGSLSIECYNKNDQYTTITFNVDKGFVIYNQAVDRALALKGLEFFELYRHAIKLDFDY